MSAVNICAGFSAHRKLDLSCRNLYLYYNTSIKQTTTNNKYLFVFILKFSFRFYHFIYMISGLYFTAQFTRRCCYIEEEETERCNPTSIPGTCSLKKLPFSPAAQQCLFMTVISFGGLGLNIGHSMVFETRGPM